MSTKQLLINTNEDSDLPYKGELRTRDMTLQVEPLRCVIIDDSPEFIVAATNTLECAGIKVVGVTMDGKEALRCAASRP